MQLTLDPKHPLAQAIMAATGGKENLDLHLLSSTVNSPGFAHKFGARVTAWSVTRVGVDNDYVFTCDFVTTDDIKIMQYGSEDPIQGVPDCANSAEAVQRLRR